MRSLYVYRKLISQRNMTDVLALPRPEEMTGAKTQPTPAEPPKWRKLFKHWGEMDQSEMRFPIANFLPEGITFIGALPASGKTWLCLSMAKALCTGKKFLGKLDVPEPHNVLYLIPEAGERSFRQRLEMMEIPADERFLCRTMTDGSIKLTDTDLLSAVAALRPVVFLDTAVRFNDSKDENDASQSSKLLTDALFALRRAGAQAVVCAHHSTKGANSNICLDTALRGSSELGANADAVYYLQVKDDSDLRVRIHCVKPRDFEPLKPFEVVGRPYIELEGDFRPAQPIDEPHFAKQDRERQAQFISAVTADPKATYSKLQVMLDMSTSTIHRVASRAGWQKGNGTPWERIAA